MEEKFLTTGSLLEYNKIRKLTSVFYEGVYIELEQKQPEYQILIFHKSLLKLNVLLTVHCNISA
jgi:hypothetical protein